MSKSRNVRSVGLVILMVAASLLPATAAFAKGDAATYSLTLENLTHTQPFSPPIFVTHTPSYSLFHVGKSASAGIQLIAETGNNSVATAEAQASPLTFNIVAQSALIFPGQSTTAEVSGPPGARFSFAAMLGITNDGFTGVDTIRLPKSGSVSYVLVSLDAGTETNNELVGYVGALGGGNLRAPTHDAIAHHTGILGIGDMDPALYGWQDPVGRLTITRID